MLVPRRDIVRWIYASVKEHIKKNYSGPTLFVEGEDHKNTEIPNYVELRLDGPVLTKIGAQYEYKATIEVNMLATIKSNIAYVHEIQDAMGECLQALPECIKIIRTGSERPQDDGTFVDYIQASRVDISNFGQVDPNMKIQQASIETTYTCNFEME